jgi:hypothetical protein
VAPNGSVDSGLLSMIRGKVSHVCSYTQMKSRRTDHENIKQGNEYELTNPHLILVFKAVITAVYLDRLAQTNTIIIIEQPMPRNCRVKSSLRS